MTAHKIPGSYRDPSSHVFMDENRIFRGVKGAAAVQMEAFIASPFFEKHNARNIVSTTICDARELKKSGFSAKLIKQYHLWLEHQKLDLITFPHEWSFQQLKAAALFHLKLQITALNAGYQIKDATSYNIQFMGTKPIFIDIPSFEPYEEGKPWVAYKQFCEHFLGPLMLHHHTSLDTDKIYRAYPDGIDLVTCSKLLPFSSYFNLSALGHIHLQAKASQKISSVSDRQLSKARQVTVKRQNLISMLRALIKAIERLKSDGATYWREYEHKNSYSTETMAEKDAVIKDFVIQNNLKRLIDLGCNAGKFSEIALNSGADHVIGMDIDSGALDTAIERFKNSPESFSPILFDMANPSPSLGWRLKERASIYERIPAVDGILCLAVIHHLVIARNIPMEEFVDAILPLAPQGIIEFVTKEDPMVIGLLSNREDIFDKYDQHYFEE